MKPSVSVKIQFSPLIKKQIKKLKKQPKLYQKFCQQLELFQTKYNHPKLKTHKLTGSLAKTYSFSVSYKLRVIFKWKNTSTVILIALGSHDQVYP